MPIMGEFVNEYASLVPVALQRCKARTAFINGKCQRSFISLRLLS